MRQKEMVIIALVLSAIAALLGARIALAGGIGDWSVFMVSPQTGQVVCAGGVLSFEPASVGLQTSAVLIHCGMATPWPTPHVVYPPTPVPTAHSYKGRPLPAPTTKPYR